MESDRQRQEAEGHVWGLRGHLAGRSPCRRSTHQAPDPRALQRHPGAASDAGVRGQARRVDHAEGCREWHATSLVDKPTMRSHAYSLLRTILASAVNDELIDGNPARIVGAGRSKCVHKIRPASVGELGVLTEAMPERLQLMVTLASWCALRFGETVELRRGDIDLSDEVIRIRRAAVRTQGAYAITSPKSDAGIRDVAIPPHLIPLIEKHLAKHVGAERDALIFPAFDSPAGHLQPSTLYRHWYRARDKAGRPDLRWHR